MKTKGNTVQRFPTHKASPEDFLFDFLPVKAFNTKPFYRDTVFDPDPDRSYTKAKVQKLEQSDVNNMLSQTSSGDSNFDNFSAGRVYVIFGLFFSFSHISTNGHFWTG